jgi:hypothetical protein
MELVPLGFSTYHRVDIPKRSGPVETNREVVVLGVDAELIKPSLTPLMDPPSPPPLLEPNTSLPTPVLTATFPLNVPEGTGIVTRNSGRGDAEAGFETNSSTP